MGELLERGFKEVLSVDEQEAIMRKYLIKDREGISQVFKGESIKFP